MLAIAMTKNLVFYTRSKYIELRHHFMKDMINKKEIQLDFINTNDQPIDVLTKAVLAKKFNNSKSFYRLQIKRECYIVICNFQCH